MNYQFSERRVYVNGYKICYLEGGTQNSESLLFLHGWGVATEPYQELINILCQRYKVIAPALQGFGKSDGENFDWNYDKYANLLLAFLQKLEIDKFHIVGHSLGGGVGITLAALVPAQVSSLILVDSTGIPVDPIPKVLFQRAIEMTAQAPQIKFPQIVQVFQGFFYNLFFKNKTTIQVLLLALKQDLKHLLPQIESPCLLVWGKNDMTTPLKAGQEFSRLIKNSRLVVVKGYHEWSIFFVDKITAIIFDFLDEIGKSNSLENKSRE